MNENYVNGQKFGPQTAVPYRPILRPAAAPEAAEMIVALALRWAALHAVTGGEFALNWRMGPITCHLYWENRLGF